MKTSKNLLLLKTLFQQNTQLPTLLQFRGIVPGWINSYLCLACLDLEALNEHFLEKEVGGKQDAPFGNQPNPTQLKIIMENWRHVVPVDAALSGKMKSIIILNLGVNLVSFDGFCLLLCVQEPAKLQHVDPPCMGVLTFI